MTQGSSKQSLLCVFLGTYLVFFLISFQLHFVSCCLVLQLSFSGPGRRECASLCMCPGVFFFSEGSGWLLDPLATGQGHSRVKPGPFCHLLVGAAQKPSVQLHTVKAEKTVILMVFIPWVQLNLPNRN